MTNERSFALVFGYLPEIDDAYAPAHQLGLRQRFAVALDSYRPGHGEMYYDHELLHAVLQAVRDLIGHDTVRIEYGSKPFRIVSGRNLTPADILFGDDPFDALFFLNGDTVTGIVHLYPYTAIGGPFPYHDTHCFSFYVARVDEAAVLNTIEHAASAHGLLLRDVVHGEPAPHISFLTKLKRLL